ncbi:MAG TPA: hypothetical protein VH062_33875 [Polyangiaceae bacterium]|jgi:predicted RNA-binding Zn-ribbon protein involved in translation (DUF1610 family)|nr:hypothetical protein [Polyangiaceae bacterium]
MADSDDTTRPTKDCPFCGESILAVAVKCKHCGEFLDGSRSDDEDETPAAKPSPGPQIYAGGKGNAPKVVCPHCGVVGGVNVERVKRKKGVSGTKATAAVLTAGISILGTGLSRKEKVSEAHCKNCRVTWIMG